MPSPSLDPLQPSNVGLSAVAADRKTGMTLDELGSLVTKAHRLGVPGDSFMTRAGWMPGPTTAGNQRFFCPEHTARANAPQRRGAVS